MNARKESRVQIKAPELGPVGAGGPEEKKKLAFFFKLLLILTYLMAGASLYLSFFA